MLRKLSALLVAGMLFVSIVPAKIYADGVSTEKLLISTIKTDG